jgi:hypothetical protein
VQWNKEAFFTETEAVMYQVRADAKKNRLYLTIGEMTEDSEMEALVNEIEHQIQNLEKGFDCVTDLQGSELRSASAEDFIFRAQQILADAGMANVVRVIKRFGAMAHFQFDNISVSVGYHAQNANSLEEAEAILDARKNRQT